MSKGILVFARNNTQIDYLKQAYFLAIKAKELLNLPTTVVTDSLDYLKKSYPDYNKVFDKVISIVWKHEDLTNQYTVLSKTENHSLRTYRDGTIVKKKLHFKNETRSVAYDVTPYDETLLLDSDILLLDNLYLNCFTQPNNFLIYDKAYDIAGFREKSQFDFISNQGVKFYWATVIFFRKTYENKIFFDLVQHIQENWRHYKRVFQIEKNLYRNDFVFSIAIHIMNGYQEGSFSHAMPGKLFYTTDKDICYAFDNESVLFLLEKEKYVGEYTLSRWKNNSIHVMNKFSYNRCIDKVING